MAGHGSRKEKQQQQRVEGWSQVGRGRQFGHDVQVVMDISDLLVVQNSSISISSEGAHYVVQASGATGGY